MLDDAVQGVKGQARAVTGGGAGCVCLRGGAAQDVDGEREWGDRGWRERKVGQQSRWGWVWGWNLLVKQGGRWEGRERRGWGSASQGRPVRRGDWWVLNGGGLLATGSLGGWCEM